MGIFHQNKTQNIQQKGDPIEALRTNILFSLPGGTEAKCIGVTSASSGDGKSTVVCRIAQSFAKIGKKVLVLECDLGQPSLAAVLGITAEPGLSNMLIGDSKVKGAIRRVEHVGIDIIPAGTPSPNPLELLKAEQFTVLLNELKKYYDYIFVEMPSGETMKKDVVLTESMDGILMIVRHNATMYQKVDETILHLRAKKAKLLGFVYNDPDKK
ncbi:MAG: CpsD/CapB family tyrosine-protein kinase [Eubacteriales bacterium]|nr:CpsD/CapB family tyrosine-protein kinase [Eubacteriales bacterium]